MRFTRPDTEANETEVVPPPALLNTQLAAGADHARYMHGAMLHSGPWGRCTHAFPRHAAVQPPAHACPPACMHACMRAHLGHEPAPPARCQRPSQTLCRWPDTEAARLTQESACMAADQAPINVLGCLPCRETLSGRSGPGGVGWSRSTCRRIVDEAQIRVDGDSVHHAAEALADVSDPGLGDRRIYSHHQPRKCGPHSHPSPHAPLARRHAAD